MKREIQLNAEAIRLREHFGQDPFSPVDIFRLIAGDKTLTITFYPMSDRISGIAVRIPGAKVIGINSALTLGRQRFTAAHELYHLFYDKDFSTTVCPREIGVSKNIKEREADFFASYFLAPYEALNRFIEVALEQRQAPLKLEDVVRIEQHFGMSRQAALVRLQNEGYLTTREARAMRTNIIASAVRLGFSPELYQITPQEKQYATYGRYVALAESLKERALVSDGKYEELLLDGFRGDIVFGMETEERYD